MMLARRPALRRPVAAALSRLALDNRFTRESSTFSNPEIIKPSFYELTSMPRLPIPSLDDICGRYLEMVRPLVTTEEFEKTAAIVKEFRSTDGPLLHEQLKQHDMESPTSYLEGFWDTMYLELRDPVPINVSPFFLFRKFNETRQAHVGALLVGASLRFIHALDFETIKPDADKSGPLCMSQYPKMFSSSRVPLGGRDVMARYSRPWKPQVEPSRTVTAAHVATSRHVVVSCRGHLYSVDVISADGQGVISEEDLAKKFQEILDHAPKETSFQLGYLTAENRDVWASARANLEQNNAELFRTVDSALFVVCFDGAYSNILTASNAALHNWGNNRWFDKTIQFIVSADGYSAVNMEHAAFDGHTQIRFLQDVFDDISKGAHQNKKPSSAELVGQQPQRLVPNLKGFEFEIASAQNQIHTFASTVETAVLQTENLGKQDITNRKMSPDALLQAAFQLAYYNQFGRFRSCYESSMVKRYFHGRTETIRSTSHAMVDFVLACKNPTLSKEQKFQALQVAMAKHKQIAADTQEGKGERALWVMKQLAAQNRVRLPGYVFPQIFKDPSYATMTTSVISTSNCGVPCLDLFGFGPVAADGIGLGYMIHNKNINVNITSFDSPKKQSSAYKGHLEAAISEVLDLAPRA